MFYDCWNLFDDSCQFRPISGSGRIQYFGSGSGRIRSFDPDPEKYSIADPDQEEYVVWIRILKNTVLRIRNTVPYNERLRSLTGMKVLGCQI